MTQSSFNTIDLFQNSTENYLDLTQTDYDISNSTNETTVESLYSQLKLNKSMTNHMLANGSLIDASVCSLITPYQSWVLKGLQFWLEGNSNS